MTAAERLLALSGATGAAGALLLIVGAGATAGDALVDYSGLSGVAAAEHLLVDRVAIPAPRPPASSPNFSHPRAPQRRLARDRRRRREAEYLLSGLL